MYYNLYFVIIPLVVPRVYYNIDHYFYVILIYEY